MRYRDARPAISGRMRGDDGALLIELAFVAPFMVLLLLGIFEFGTAWRNETILVSALRAAARIEAQNPLSPNADQQAIQTFMASTIGLKNMKLQRLVIYDAPVGGNAPTNCRTFSMSQTSTTPQGRGTPYPTAPTIGTNCNVYNQAMTDAVNSAANGGPALPAGTFGTCGSTGWDQFYCPLNRDNTLDGSGGGADLIGVYAEYTYTDVTDLLPGKTLTITDQVSYTAQPSV
jgi:Flp pilus assembly protein TadG